MTERPNSGLLDRESVATGRSLRRAQRGSGDQVRAAEDAVAGDGAVLRVLVPHHVRHVRRDDLRHSIPRRFLLRHHSTGHPGQDHFILAVKGLWRLDVMGPYFPHFSPGVHFGDIPSVHTRKSMLCVPRPLSHRPPLFLRAGRVARLAAVGARVRGITLDALDHGEVIHHRSIIG